MGRWMLWLVALPLLGHDIITTRITWSREISRIVHQRCASCHRPGGAAPMALLTYDEARPWARSIAEEVLERRMPPWNPVKGFGEFKHDAGLSQEEIGLIAEWVEGGAPRGEDRYLPPLPVPAPSPRRLHAAPLPLTDGLALRRPLVAQGIAVLRLAEGGAVTAWAELPDGTTTPLLEIAAFRLAANQPHEFAQPLRLPTGTRFRLEGTGRLALLSSGASPAHRNGTSAPRRIVAPAAKAGAPRAGEK